MDYAVVSFSLSSFSVPQQELPPDWGYFSAFNSEIASASYTLCSFSFPIDSLPADWGYFGINNPDNSSAFYTISSFSLPDNQITLAYPMDSLSITGTQTSIYGIGSNAASVFSIAGSRQPSFTFWEILTAGSTNYTSIPTFRNSLTCWLSGGESWYDASLTQLSARMVIGIDGKTYKTTPIALKPYQTPLDIPNLQLWLDASDINSFTLPNSSWLDKSINALTATQTVTANRPILLYNEINGLNALSFNSANNNHLNLSSPIPLSGNFSHFFVYKRFSATAVSQSLGNKVAGSQSSFLHWSSSKIYSANVSTPVISLTETLIGGTRKNQYLQLDFTPYTLSNWSGSTTTSVNTIGVYNNANYHSGLIGEIIHAGSLLPDEEINLINSKLFDKWKVPNVPPFIRTSQSISAPSVSALSTTLGSWVMEPTAFSIEWQKSNNNSTYTTIPNASSILYSPTTADCGLFIRTSISASNVAGNSLPSYSSNVLQLTTENVSASQLVRTTIFTLSTIPGIWNSTMPLTYYYQYQINTGSGWNNYQTLTTSTTAYISGYETTPFDARVNEYVYNSTLELP